MTQSDAFITTYTLAIGAVGAVIAWALGFPVFLITGPALLLSLIGVTGLPLKISTSVRDIAFLFIGLGIGTGVDAQAADAFLRWPLAFLALAGMLTVALWASQLTLNRLFGFDPVTAVLAATPGHLSFVIGLGESEDADTTKIIVTQAVRLLALTLTVPFIAMLLGVDFNAAILPNGTAMSAIHVLILLALAVPFGLLLKRFKTPAGLLIGAMIISSIGHLSDITPGHLTPYIAMPSFLIIGTLIGSRFSGITLPQLRRYLSAGLATTALTVGIAIAVAVPVAAFLDMPLVHVLVAFAPGGLETMIAMGAVLGANAGFIAACHVGRLLLLTVLVPAMLVRFRRK